MSLFDTKKQTFAGGARLPRDRPPDRPQGFPAGRAPQGIPLAYFRRSVDMSTLVPSKVRAHVEKCCLKRIWSPKNRCKWCSRRRAGEAFGDARAGRALRVAENESQARQLLGTATPSRTSSATNAADPAERGHRGLLRGPLWTTAVGCAMAAGWLLWLTS